MFIKKDTRKVAEILYDEKDDRSALLLARREAEFAGDTRLLCDPASGSQLRNTRQLSLYGNKLRRLAQWSTVVNNAPLEELNVRSAWRRRGM
jgi:hypothetical protein